MFPHSSTPEQKRVRARVYLVYSCVQSGAGPDSQEKLSVRTFADLTVRTRAKIVRAGREIVQPYGFTDGETEAQTESLVQRHERKLMQVQLVIHNPEVFSRKQ